MLYNKIKPCRDNLIVAVCRTKAWLQIVAHSPILPLPPSATTRRDDATVSDTFRDLNNQNMDPLIRMFLFMNTTLHWLSSILAIGFRPSNGCFRMFIPDWNLYPLNQRKIVLVEPGYHDWLRTAADEWDRWKSIDQNSYSKILALPWHVLDIWMPFLNRCNCESIDPVHY